MTEAARNLKPGCSRRLEFHHGEFLLEITRLRTADIGELIGMLVAESVMEPVPEPSNKYVSEAFARRDSYRRVIGSFGRESLPLSVRKAVFDRDGRVCRYCDASLTWDDYHCDHVFPVSKGGSDSMENLAASCEPCNRSKGAKTLQEWRG